MANRYRIYRSLLKLYPTQYRQRYGAQMQQTLDDMLGDQPNGAARLLVWLRAYADLATNIPQQNLTMIGGSLMQKTPPYIRNNALIGTALIVPFWVLVFSGLLQKQWFAGSGQWMALAVICLLILPAIAVLLNIVSYAKWLAIRDDKTNRTVIRRMLDVRRTYPTICVGLVGLFIVLFVPFHDSAHCILQNPLRTVHNPHQTQQCISRGFLGGK